MLDLNDKSFKFLPQEGSPGSSGSGKLFDNLPDLQYKGSRLLPAKDLYHDRVFLYLSSDGLKAVVKPKSKEDSELFKRVKGVDCNIVGMREVGNFVVMNAMDGDMRDLAFKMARDGAPVVEIYRMAVAATLAVAEAYGCLMESGLYYMDGKTDNSLFAMAPDGSVTFSVGDLDSLYPLKAKSYVRTFVDPTIIENYGQEYPRPALQTEDAARRYVAFQAWLVLFDFLTAAGITTWYIPRAREVERVAGGRKKHEKLVMAHLRRMLTARAVDPMLEEAIRFLQPRMAAYLKTSIPLIDITSLSARK